MKLTNSKDNICRIQGTLLIERQMQLYQCRFQQCAMNIFKYTVITECKDHKQIQLTGNKEAQSHNLHTCNLIFVIENMFKSINVRNKINDDLVHN